MHRSDTGESETVTRWRLEIVKTRKDARELRDEADRLERVADVLENQLRTDYGKSVDLDTGEVPEGSLTDGVRAFLKSQNGVPARVKDVEHWLIRKGYRTGAKSFYHSVHSTLRAMAEVCGVAKKGEVVHFALRDDVKIPAGWHKVEFPRRVSIYQRYTDPKDAQDAMEKGNKARGAGRG